MADLQELVGGYKLRSLLQSGQTSQVYEVVEPSSGRHFAMKILLPESSTNREQRHILFHEAEVGIELRHENVIRIHKVNHDATSPHFIMEFFPAGSLRGKLQQKETSFVREFGLKMFKQAATGLAYMHGMGWLHCDVKPDNWLVNSLGELRLIDFAISKKIPKGWRKWLHRKKKAQGTPSFMSPEQIRDEILDERADIYSFGATLYELTTGRPPFRAASMNDLLNMQIAKRADTPQSYNPDLTDDFCALVLKMLEKKKEARYANFHEVLMALRNIRVFKVSTPAKQN